VTEPGSSTGHQDKKEDTDKNKDKNKDTDKPGLLARLQATHLLRTWANYSSRRGGVLASGMAYIGLFSVFGALATGFSIFAQVLGGNTDLFGQVVSAVDSNLPGLLDVGPDGGAISPDDLVQSENLSLAGAVAFVTTLVAGLGWLDATRESIRAMFDLPTLQGNVVVKKLRDVGVLATLGLVLVLSAVLSLAVNAAARPILRVVGVEGGPISTAILFVLSTLVVLAVDALIFVVLFRVLSGLTIAWPDLRTSVLIGAVGLGILKLLAGRLLGSAGSGNPLLATGAVIVGLLVWLNLVSRLTLLSASWVATTVHDPVTSLVKSPSAAQARGRAHAVLGASGRPVELGPREPLMPTFGQRSADRTALAAGVVLGGLGLAALRVIGTGVGTVVRSVRGG